MQDGKTTAISTASVVSANHHGMLLLLFNKSTKVMLIYSCTVTVTVTVSVVSVTHTGQSELCVYVYLTTFAGEQELCVHVNGVYVC